MNPSVSSILNEEPSLSEHPADGLIALPVTVLALNGGLLLWRMNAECGRVSPEPIPARRGGGGGMDIDSLVVRFLVGKLSQRSRPNAEPAYHRGVNN